MSQTVSFNPLILFEQGFVLDEKKKKQEAHGPQCSPELTAASLSGHLLIIPY